MIYEYFKDKYMDKARATVTSMLMMFMLLLMLPSVTGISFNDESIKASAFSFEWCSDNPFETETSLYKSDLELYNIDIGCGIKEQHLVAIVETPYIEEVCEMKESCKEISTPSMNGTTTSYSCSMKEVCINMSKTVSEEYDLEKTDLLLQKADKICLRATRTEPNGKCDMNYRYPSLSFDAADYGKAWWNTSFSKKIPIIINATNTGGYATIELELNSTIAASMHSDGCDMAFVNSTETGEFSYWYNTSAWERGDYTVFINVSHVGGSNTTMYLYLNSSVCVDNRDESVIGSAYWTLHNNVTSLWDTSADSHDDGQLIGSFTFTTDHEGNANYAYDCGSEANNYHFNATPANSFDDNVKSYVVAVWARVDDAGVAGKFGKMMSGGQWVNPYDSMWIMHDVAQSKFWHSYSGGDQSMVSNGLYTSPGAWYHTIAQWNGTHQVLYINGSKVNSSSVASIDIGDPDFTLCARKDGAVSYAEPLDGAVSRAALWVNKSFTDLEAEVWFGKDYSIGLEEDLDIQTTLRYGIYDENWNNISTIIDEGEDFRIWAEFNYTDNSSIVHPNAWCNISADDIIQESYLDNEGTNSTVCTSGCDYTNRTKTFTGLDTLNYQYDIYRFQLCRDTPTLSPSFTISNNCSGSYTSSYADIVNCDVGYSDFTLNDGNCTESSINMSIWSSGLSNQELILVDDFMGVDRLHNHTGNLTWNVTTGTFVSSELFEYYVQGTNTVYISCQPTINFVQNHSVSMTLTVENAAPINIIDDIWWWLLGLPVTFTDGISAKYPLSNTLNVTALCSDINLQNFGAYLNYSNGTNIQNDDFTATGTIELISINYSSSAFTTNLTFLDGLDDYTWTSYCNDSDGNVTYQEYSLSVENLVPVASWVNSTTAISSIPSVFNFTCVDDESESYTSYVLVNGTTNQTGTDDSGLIFDFAEGDYILNVTCEDSYRNATHDTLTVSYLRACLPNIFGVVPGDRFADNIITMNVNCSNSVSIDSCSYFINDFRGISVECSNNTMFNVTAERGWNDFTLEVYGNNARINSSLNFWAKDQDASVFDYPVLWIMLLIMLFSFALGEKLGVLYVFGGVAGIIVGLQLVAFSAPLGLGVAVMAPVIALFLVWSR